MEKLGFWELVHGTSAGCASIAAWETMRTFSGHGPVLLVAYGVVTLGLFQVQQKHLKRIAAKKAAQPPVIPDLTEHARLIE